MNEDTLLTAKKSAAKAALNFIEDGMIVGLGTGSTATIFIDCLIEKCQKTGMNVRCVASSEKSLTQARLGNMIIEDPNLIEAIDITVDGADEVNKKKQLIKGGGGALLREKIVADMSHEMIVIADFTKVVEVLGNFPLPIEIVPFAYQATLRKIRFLGFEGHMRLTKEGNLYLTDNGNYIVDLKPNKYEMPEIDQASLKNITGVIETGFFLNQASRVIVGYPNGTVKTFN